MDHSEYVRGIVLLFLMIFANYLGPTLNCSVQRLISHNMYFKQIIVFISIYFALNYTTNKIENPMHHIRTSLIIWFALLIITKLHTGFAFIIYILLVAYYFMFNYREYNKQENKDYSIFQTYIKYLEYTMYVVTTIGLVLYFRKQFTEHRKNFSFLKFFVGVEKCVH